MKLETLENKKILIVGAGKEGKTTYAFLKDHFPKQIIDLVDQNDGSDYLQHIADYETVIKSPGIKPDILSVPYTTAANIFFGNVRGITIGVTGTKGKSTTATLIHTILQQAGKKSHLVGNIGNPMLEELSKTNDKEDIWVCELSSYQIADLQYSPHISVILNLFPEHMDYHGSIRNYYEAKKHLVVYATKEDFFVYNPKSDELSELASQTKAIEVPFVEALPFEEKIIPLLGKHNKENVKAAITVAGLFDIPSASIEAAVKKFKALPHRLEYVGTYNDIRFYDDAISTTPESTIKAIESLSHIGTIFLGGQDRGYDFSKLAKVLIKYTIPNIVVFPDSGKKIIESLREQTQNLPNILETTSMLEAVKFTYKSTKPGYICLHSPASPSYSLWKNFQERGDEFQKEVKNLASSSS